MYAVSHKEGFSGKRLRYLPTVTEREVAALSGFAAEECGNEWNSPYRDKSSERTGVLNGEERRSAIRHV